MESTSEQKPLNLCRVLCKTRRLIKIQHRTFLVLAFLFLFPSSLATVLVPLFLKSLSHDKTPVKILLSLAYYFFSLFFSPLAIASITYTAIHGFNGEPVKVKQAFKSITASYFPLLSTALANQFVIFFVTLGFALAATAFITKGFLGLAASPYLVGFLVAIFVSVVLLLQAIWTLGSAVVVAESRCGFAALKRSKKLIKGTRVRALALSLGLILGLFYLLFSWNNYSYTTGTGGTSRPSDAAEWQRFFFSVCMTLVGCLSNACFATLFQLWGVVSSAVLYVYCTAHESASGEYVCLLGDDDRVTFVA